MVLIRPEDVDKEYYGIYKGKTPKRTLHFSDGMLDEYETDEEAEERAREVHSPKQDVVDVASLTWGPWLLYKTWAAGSTTLGVIDYIGETVASIFGITTPKYYFELEEYKKRQVEAEQLQEERKGWSDASDAVVNIPLSGINNTQPHPISV